MKLLNILPAIALFAALALSCSAQVECTLAVDQPPKPLKAGEKINAKLTVEIDPSWHIYSLTQPDGGPVRSELTLSKGQPFKLAGKIDAPDPDVQHSDAFGINVESYQGEVVFTLPLQATDSVPPGTKLQVEFTYQACTEETCNLPKTQKVEAAIGTDGSPK
jgi:thiol:disulfide interchange protein DsbD